MAGPAATRPIGYVDEVPARLVLVLLGKQIEERRRDQLFFAITQRVAAPAVDFDQPPRVLVDQHEDIAGVLLQFLQQNGVGHLSELATRLGVSVSTVRRDLDKLEQQGHVQRIRGGALYTKQPELEPPFDSRWQ